MSFILEPITILNSYRINNEFFSIRYSIGETDLPFFTQWVQQVLNIDLTLRNVPREKFSSIEIPPSRVSTSLYLFYLLEWFLHIIYYKIIFNSFSDLLNTLEEMKIDHTTDSSARLLRSHGQTLYDIYSLRYGKCFPRICDLVVWPGMYYLVLSCFVIIVLLQQKYILFKQIITTL